MSEDELKQLLQDIKDYLKITWKDETTDKNLLGMIKRGMTHLNSIAGVSLNFLEEDSPRGLLFDYVRYANSQALEMFDINFQSDLVSLHYIKQAELISLDEEGVGNEN